MTRNQKKKLHERARLSHLARLYAEQNSLCHWCHSATVMLRYIRKESIVRINNGGVVWRIGEETFFARIATVDHLVKVSDGGGNEPENVVMACATCNKDRTKTRSPVPDSIRKVCSCGAPKHKRSRFCRACRIARSMEWLAGLGWQAVPGHTDSEKHFQFVDPDTGRQHILRCAIKQAVRKIRQNGSATTPPE